MDKSNGLIGGLAVGILLIAGAVFAIAGGFGNGTANVGSDSLRTAVARMPPKLTFTPVFEPCAHCHEIGDGARTSSGPVLNGIVGRKAGARDDYPYSQAMKDSGIVWTEANLQRFLESPGAVVSGTRMAVGGFSEDQIDPIIDFLKTVPAS